jgi:hypothetical protein
LSDANNIHSADVNGQQGRRAIIGWRQRGGVLVEEQSQRGKGFGCEKKKREKLMASQTLCEVSGCEGNTYSDNTREEQSLARTQVDSKQDQRLGTNPCE